MPFRNSHPDTAKMQRWVEKIEKPSVQMSNKSAIAETGGIRRLPLPHMQRDIFCGPIKKLLDARTVVARGIILNSSTAAHAAYAPRKKRPDARPPSAALGDANRSLEIGRQSS